ncbi:MAG: glycoside hydrolase family 95-like protein [Planctomycetota bacterium]
MKHTMTAAMLLLMFPWGEVARAEEPAVPFPEAVQAAAISVDRLDSILDYGLLLGNGDLNALVSSEGGRLVLTLTKNDVWDARLDSKLDPPLPTLDLIKRLAAEDTPAHGGRSTILEEGWGNHAEDSYHAHPYPCPRACGRLVLSDRPLKSLWRQIRSEGTHNAWEYRDGAAVMTIEGQPDASNGYALEPLGLSTDDYDRLRITISGTENARYYVDVMGTGGGILFNTGWTETPVEPETVVFDLPPGEEVDRLILYTWTEDAHRAENRFREVAFEGPGGALPVDLRDLAAPTSPARLDLARAVVNVAGVADGPSEAQVRALADRNVLLIKTSAASQLLRTSSADVPQAVIGEDDGVAWLHQEIPGDPDWPGMSFAVAVASRDAWKAVAIVTSREAADPRSAAIALARSTLEQDPDELIRRHEAHWSRFWSASGIEIDDAVLEAMWYRNLYFLRSVSRPGAIAPGLFASLIDDRPAWHGDYHTNYNIQQTFWSAYVTNHPELAEPYDRLIREYFPRARWLARRVFSMEGAYYPHVLFAYEPPHPEKCQSPGGRQYLHHVWGFTIGVAGFTVQPLWWHYKYEPSREFLEETAYPAVRDVAVFYADFIDHCEGDATVVLAPSVSPEHWGWTKDFLRNRNCAFDIAMARYTLEAAIEGAETLGRDADLVARWKRALLRLPPYPTTKEESPVVVDVEDAPPISYNIAVPAVPVFPGDVVTWFSPESEKELFARTIQGMAWNGNNSAIMLSVARARLSMPDTADWVREELSARLRPNGTLTLNRNEPQYGFNRFGHYSEQFAASMAVSELLLQSVGDVIRIFPAWPKDRDARFENLRAQGGFLVSAEQKDGQSAQVAITSTVGGPLRLVNPWPAIQVQRAGEESIEIAPDERGVVQVDTSAGERLILRPAKGD